MATDPWTKKMLWAILINVIAGLISTLIVIGIAWYFLGRPNILP